MYNKTYFHSSNVKMYSLQRYILLEKNHIWRGGECKKMRFCSQGRKIRELAQEAGLYLNVRNEDMTSMIDLWTLG